MTHILDLFSYPTYRANHRTGRHTHVSSTFFGTCSCGVRSPEFHSAGLVHGWHNAHLEEHRRGA